MSSPVWVFAVNVAPVFCTTVTNHPLSANKNFLARVSRGAKSAVSLPFLLSSLLIIYFLPVKLLYSIYTQRTECIVAALDHY